MQTVTPIDVHLALFVFNAVARWTDGDPDTCGAILPIDNPAVIIPIKTNKTNGTFIKTVQVFPVLPPDSLYFGDLALTKNGFVCENWKTAMANPDDYGGTSGGIAVPKAGRGGSIVVSRATFDASDPDNTTEETLDGVRHNKKLDGDAGLIETLLLEPPHPPAPPQALRRVPRLER